MRQLVGTGVYILAGLILAQMAKFAFSGEASCFSSADPFYNHLS